MQKRQRRNQKGENKEQKKTGKSSIMVTISDLYLEGIPPLIKLFIVNDETFYTFERDFDYVWLT